MKAIPLIVACAIALIPLALACGRPGARQQVAEADTVAAPWDLVGEGEDPGMLPDPGDDADEWDSIAPPADADTARTAEQPVTPEADRTTGADTLPTVAFDRRRYGRIGPLAEVFNDSNRYQYAAGERIGIRPIHSLADAYYLRRPMVKVASCQWYDVDELTHSIPYLVPEAAQLLGEIGRNFTDSLAARGIRGHKFRVTSVLRTRYSVKRLRRVNGNATDSSTHQLATTFDISYASFNHDGRSPRHSDEELKLILAQVLADLRARGKCMVKYERKSPCFHITATGR